jgi:type VI secretion system secreted protein Hcp
MSREEANGLARAAERVRRSRLMRAPMKVVVPTAAALGAGAAVGAVAIGAIPGSDGVIHACYEKNVVGADFEPGALRVLDPGNQGPNTDYNSCTANETPINWSQQGPPGPQGPQGPSGAAGSAAIVGNTNFEISASPHVAMFLKLNGIKGESQDDKHKGDIDIESFAFGSEAPVVSARGTGAGAGKVTISTFQIVSKVNKATPKLEQDLATGKIIHGGEVDVVHRSAKGDAQVASYKVTDLALKSISIKGEKATVLGSFKAVNITLGSGQNTVSAKWNKVQNTGSWNLIPNKPG